MAGRHKQKMPRPECSMKQAWHTYIIHTLLSTCDYTPELATGLRHANWGSGAVVQESLVKVRTKIARQWRMEIQQTVTTVWAPEELNSAASHGHEWPPQAEAKQNVHELQQALLHHVPAGNIVCGATVSCMPFYKQPLEPFMHALLPAQYSTQVAQN